MTFIAEKASKEQAKARWVIEGPAGSGKTFTSLALATGLGDTTVLIDTVQRQSLVFADRFDFDVIHMANDFHPDRLVEALAVCSPYHTTIIDTFSSFWSGPNGMLELVDQKSDGRSGGTFSNGWKEMGPVERRMVEAILAHPGHVILTLRVKTEWVVQPGPDGKYKPLKVGTKPDQRDKLDYEMGIVSTLNDAHTLTFTKSPYDGFDGRIVERPTAELGREYRLWLDDGKEPVTVWQLRDRAFDAKTADELRQLRAEVQYLNKWNAPMTDEHGDPSTLGAIIGRLGREKVQAEREAARS